MKFKMKKLSAKLICLVLVVITLVACMAPAYAISPASTKSAKATLAFTLKGLPLGRAVQNFYMGSTYIYITQRVDATTYVSRLKMDKANKVANYVDRMTFTNCGHGQSLDMYTYNGVNYMYMGCKSDTDSGYNWSLQIARIKYEAGKTYNYTNLHRFTYMNYANGSAYRMGDTYRVAAAVCGEKAPADPGGFLEGPHRFHLHRHPELVAAKRDAGVPGGHYRIFYAGGVTILKTPFR